MPNFSFERVTMSLEPRTISLAAPFENQLSHNHFIINNTTVILLHTDLLTASHLDLLNLVTNSTSVLYIIEPQTSEGSSQSPVFNGGTRHCQTGQQHKAHKGMC